MSASKSIAAAVSQFQSTRSVWGVTNRYPIGPGRFWISIHTPRVGRDVIGVFVCVHVLISIHTPRVGRDVVFYAL